MEHLGQIMQFKFTRIIGIFITTLVFGGQFGLTQNKTKQELTEQQQLFIKAETALTTNQIPLFNQLQKQLITYPLLEYLERDRLLQQLSKQSINKPIAEPFRLKIDQFLQQYNNQVVSRKLRYKWLDYLANAKQTNLFIEYYQPSYSIKLKCRFLEFQIKKGEPINNLHSTISSIWLTGRSLPNSCDPLIALWRSANLLTDELIWQRMLIAADEKQYSLVKYLNGQQPATYRLAGEHLVKVSRNSESLLKIKFGKNLNQLEKSVIFKGLNKLAWKSAPKTIKAWKAFGERLQLSNVQTAKLKRSIGLSLAIEQSPTAKDWLRSLDVDTDTSVDQWLLSTALTTEDWSLIDHLTRQKNKHSIDVNKWRYWRAISTKNSGYSETSNWLMKSLASTRGYYGFLAALTQNQEPQLNIKPEVVSLDVVKKLANKDSAQKARQFYQLGRLTNARKEWNQLILDTAPVDYVALAQLAYQWGWNHQSILAFAKSKKIDDVEKRFPFYLKEIYQSESNKQQIPMTWAYAITRQESAFMEDASSTAGALGLMQLTPSTARLVAKKQAKYTGFNVKPNRLNKAQLHTPAINIKLGIAHLKEMLDYYDGHPILATAAYNAGKHRVDSWLADNTISDSILWIEQIPYKETREYVKNVLTYQQIYTQLAKSSDSFLANLASYPIPIKQTVQANITAR